jgi:DNA-binding CsgD family transcriptional regulator
VLQAALMAFFTAAPMFWCDILKITLGKYRIIFFSADILYAAVSLAIIFLYVSRGDLLLIKAFENSNMLAQEMLNTFVVTIVFFRLNNIVNRFLRYSLLLINIIIAIYIPVYLFEYFRYGTFFSPVIFILAFNVLFIIPTLFNAGRMNLTEEKGIPDHFISSHNITDREKEIIIFLLNGLSYSEISDRLFISDKTVETHVYNIYRKTGVKNRIQLFRLISPGLK